MTDFIVKYWLQVLLTGICGIAAAAYKKLSSRVKREVKEQQLLKEGVLALLHDQLYRGCRECIASGSIDVEGLKNIGYLYTSYHALGGNGTGTELYERVKNLPIKEGT